jgi:cardiolipin synthase A/B
VVVADMQYAMVGGINISNRYNDMPGKPAWLDFAMYVEGEIALELCVLCWKSWFGFPTKMKITPCEIKEITYNIKSEQTSFVRMRRQDWVRRKMDISKTYLEMLRNAKSEIIILCSYFLPGKQIRRLLTQAAGRGVIISVITTGRSDVMVAKYAERWLYDWMLRRNIQLYEYQRNILHGKIASCDAEWVTIGSYNINDLSAYASVELNLDVKNEKTVQETDSVLRNIMSMDCIHITEERHEKTKNVFKQFTRWVSYHLLRLLLYLFTFYYKQRS